MATYSTPINGAQARARSAGPVGFQSYGAMRRAAGLQGG